MGRKVQNKSTYAGGSLRWFTPTAFGNDRDPKPVRAEIRQPNEGEKRRLIAIDDCALASAVGRHISVVFLALELCVPRVEEYQSEHGVPILTGRDLVEYGEWEFQAEIAGEILKHVNLGDESKKGSGGPPDSSSEATPPPDGPAPIAEHEGSKSSEDASREQAPPETSGT